MAEPPGASRSGEEAEQVVAPSSAIPAGKTRAGPPQTDIGILPSSDQEPPLPKECHETTEIRDSCATACNAPTTVSAHADFSFETINAMSLEATELIKLPSETSITEKQITSVVSEAAATVVKLKSPNKRLTTIRETFSKNVHLWSVPDDIVSFALPCCHPASSHDRFPPEDIPESPRDISKSEPTLPPKLKNPQNASHTTTHVTNTPPKTNDITESPYDKSASHPSLLLNTKDLQNTAKESLTFEPTLPLRPKDLPKPNIYESTLTPKPSPADLVPRRTWYGRLPKDFPMPPRDVSSNHATPTSPEDTSTLRTLQTLPQTVLEDILRLLPLVDVTHMAPLCHTLHAAAAAVLRTSLCGILTRTARELLELERSLNSEQGRKCSANEKKSAVLKVMHSEASVIKAVCWRYMEQDMVLPAMGRILDEMTTALTEPEMRAELASRVFVQTDNLLDKVEAKWSQPSVMALNLLEVLGCCQDAAYDVVLSPRGVNHATLSARFELADATTLEAPPCLDNGTPSEVNFRKLNRYLRNCVRWSNAFRPMKELWLMEDGIEELGTEEWVRSREPLALFARPLVRRDTLRTIELHTLNRRRRRSDSMEMRREELGVMCDVHVQTRRDFQLPLNLRLPGRDGECLTSDETDEEEDDDEEEEEHDLQISVEVRTCYPSTSDPNILKQTDIHMAVSNNAVIMLENEDLPSVLKLS